MEFFEYLWQSFREVVLDEVSRILVLFASVEFDPDDVSISYRPMSLKGAANSAHSAE